jgi:hypothetical protein
MGYLDGFAVTIRQHRLFGGKQVTTARATTVSPGCRAASRAISRGGGVATASAVASASRRGRHPHALPTHPTSGVAGARLACTTVTFGE